MSDIKNVILDVLQSIKAGIIVSVTSIGSGLGMLLDLIPNEIGKLATLFGIILTMLLIYVHVVQLRMKWAKEKREIEHHLLEMAVLRAKRHVDETDAQTENE